MKPVKTAVIGVGHDHATQTILSLRKMTDMFDVVCFAPVEDDKEKYPGRLPYLDGVEEKTVESVLNDPEIEAVLVETEEKDLTKYATLAAKHGKHVQMDKPGGYGLGEFEEMISSFKKTGKVLHMGYMYRYNPEIKRVIEEAKRGDYGEIVSVEALMDCHYKREKRQWIDRFEGGMMFYLGCHLVDLIMRIQGTPLNVIPLSKSTGVEGVTSKDFGMAVLEYEHGNSLAKCVMMQFGGFARRSLIVTGSKRTVELRPLETYIDTEKTKLYTVRTEWDRHDWSNLGDVSRSGLFGRYEPMLRDFAEVIRGEKENPYTYDYELELFATLLKCCGQ